ncbi:hypothetical protein BG000_001846 [Podila horticola]|nr:hypothetical protein BG000_001846 [Podila horticola]
MSSIVLDTSPEHVAYALLGCFIIFFGLVSLFVKEKLFISEAFVATAFGIIIGPYAIGIFNPMGWKDFDRVTLEFTRIVIAVQVMAAGVSLPRSYMVKEKRSLFMMIVPLMILMWLTSALLIWALIPDVDFVESMVLAACVTPTDPVLSNSVVKGRFAEKHVPPRIRYLLSAESGINDGMGLPFLFLGLYLMREPSTGVAFAKWFYMVWVYQILLSIVLGGLIGAAARKLVKGAKNRNLIDKESFLVFSIALALAVVGCVSILASDDLLACFIAGNVFAWDDWFSNEIAEAHIQETIDMLLNLACFVYIGASIPFANFHDAVLGLSIWRLILLAFCILLFRRLPFVVALKPWIPALATHREAAFAGWFGPIGVGAVFFTKVTAGMTNPDNLGDNPHNIDRLLRVRSIIYPIVMFLVLSSVLIHGVTVPLLHLQYKYTRTWSRKREESSHVVTRLPHINIGDEIVLRPPTISGSSTGGLAENGVGDSGSSADQKTIAYDNQRSIGSLNQRSLGVSGYAGFGALGFDLTKTTSNTNTTRTLEDVVQEMKEAARGKTGRSPNITAVGGLHPLIHVNSTDVASYNGDTSIHTNRSDGFSINIGTPDKDDSSFASTYRSAQQGESGGGTGGFFGGGRRRSTSGTSLSGVVQSLRESHPASQGLNILPTDVRSGSVSGSSGSSATVTGLVQSPEETTYYQHQLQQQQQQHQLLQQNIQVYGQDHGQYLQPPPPRMHIHEVEREEHNGNVRTVTHEIPVEQQERIAREIEHTQDGEGSPGSPRGLHLSDFFKRTTDQHQN